MLKRSKCNSNGLPKFNSYDSVLQYLLSSETIVTTSEGETFFGTVTFLLDKTMPDGFDPGREIARIMTLQELMTACRERAPTILALADDMLVDPSVSHETRLRVMEFLTNRGFGKPRQHVVVTDPDGRLNGPNINPVKVYLPDNRRQYHQGPIIDAGQEEDIA